MLHQRDETEALLEDSVGSFLAHEHRAERLRIIYTGQPAHDRSFWKQLAAQGWLALRLPESLGGSALQTRHAGTVANGFGRRAVPEPFIACAAMPAALASALAGHPGWKPVIDGLISGEYVASVAWQEHPQSLDVAAHNTVVESTDAGYVLSGLKYGVVAASFADSLLVSAMFEGEPSLWVVPRICAGVTLRERNTSDGSTLAVVQLRDVLLSEAALLARGALVERSLDAAVNEAVLLASAQLCGIATTALDLTLEYLRTRVQFGRHIGSFQSLQHLAVDARIQQVLSEAAYQSALQRHADAADAPATHAAIAAAKARSSDAAMLAGRFGVQAHGAIGFAAEADIGLYLKAAIRLAAYLGNGSLQRQRFRSHAQLQPEIG